jgi:hypothetical protein
MFTVDGTARKIITTLPDFEIRLDGLFRDSISIPLDDIVGVVEKALKDLHDQQAEGFDVDLGRPDARARVVSDKDQKCLEDADWPWDGDTHLSWALIVPVTLAALVWVAIGLIVWGIRRYAHGG